MLAYVYCGRLEAERHLQVDAPVCGGRGVRAARKAIGLAEERRTQIADGRGKVHVIENIPRRNAERQIVTVVVRHDVHSATAAAGAVTAAPAPATGSARASGATTKRAAGSGAARAGVQRFFFLAEAEGFAETQVERKAARTGQRIDGSKAFIGQRNEI